MLKNYDETIRGNWATLLLPINSNDSIDYNRLSDEIDYLIECKVSGIYSNGTAGEFFTQTEEEFEKINSILAKKCVRAGMPFQIGASHMSPQISLERAKYAESLKPLAIQVILPDWFPVGDDEAIEFLLKISQETKDTKLVLYNPPHAKKVLEPKTYKKIKDTVINVVGIKVSGGDLQWYEDMKNCIPDVSIFIPGHVMATGIKNGAHGSYSNVASLSPRATQQWYKTIMEDIEEGLRMEKSILEFMKQYIIPYITKYKYPDYACDKLLAAIGGWADIGTRLRWPYKWIPDSDAVILRRYAKKMVPWLDI